MSHQFRVAVAGLLMIVGLDVASADADSPTQLLRSYIGIDTSNPPGNEAAAAQLLAERLHREGIATRLLVSPGGRTNLYARLDGGASAEGTLVLLHHLDVVPPADGWSVEPFAGRVDGGFVWGAGAVDDKSLGVAHLVAFLEAHRSGGERGLHLVLLAVADEETGGAEGTAWLLERHGDLFSDVVAVFGEGGSNRVHDGQTRWWGIEVAQKRPLWLELTARGNSGHGSKLDLHTAPNKLIAALGRLLELPRVYRVTPEARLYFESIEAIGDGAPGEWRERVEHAIDSGRIERFLRLGQHNLFLDTLQVTLLDSGRQVNAIPARARALVDVRALPDSDLEELLQLIRRTAGRDVRVKVLLEAPQVAPSPVDHPMFRCLQGHLGREAPVVPIFIAGVTDARHFRQRDIPTYGVSPFAIGPGDAQGVHGVDERISQSVFERGVETMSALVRECTGP